MMASRASSAGLTVSSKGAKSTTCSSRPVRDKCLRKRCPKPAPSAAPSIRPGDVCHDEAVVFVDAHDAQVWMQGW